MELEKPELLNEVAESVPVIAIAQLPKNDGILSIHNDKSIRMWLLRENAKYWPSVCNYLTSKPCALFYSEIDRNVFVGLDNGKIIHFRLSEDCNRIDHIKDYTVHSGRVVCLYYSSTQTWILSCTHDGVFQLTCPNVEHKSIKQNHLCVAKTCTAMEYCENDHLVFIGDFTGSIFVCKINQKEEIQFITNLKGHENSVQSLHWDKSMNLLFSGSFDNTIRVWEINGAESEAYKCLAHIKKVIFLKRLPQCGHLLSLSEDGRIVLWDMTIKRNKSPDPSKSNNCEICNRPFIWNLRGMYNLAQIGVRRHHCRNCGKSICHSCSSKELILPSYGYEIPVRICDNCYTKKTADNHPKPLTRKYELNCSVATACFDDTTNTLITVGTSNMKIWSLQQCCEVVFN